MKRLSTFVLALVAMAFMMTLNSCQEPIGTPDDSSAQLTDMPSLMVAGTTFTETDMTDATVSQDMAMEPPMMRQMKFMPFGRILGQLKLDSAQKVAIRELMVKHQDCMKTAMEELRLAEQKILDDARTQRQAILADLKAGTITKTEAMTKMRDLNKATREALANLPERTIATDAAKKCTDDLFAGIRALLTTDQQVIWDKWVSTLGDVNNCGRGKGMGMGGRRG